jgi:hypothetical protein
MLCHVVVPADVACVHVTPEFELIHMFPVVADSAGTTAIRVPSYDIVTDQEYVDVPTALTVDHVDPVFELIYTCAPVFHPPPARRIAPFEDVATLLKYVVAETFDAIVDHELPPFELKYIPLLFFGARITNPFEENVT